MSNWKGHLVGGTIAGCAVASYYAATNTDISVLSSGTDNLYIFFGALVIIAILFGLFPDIDTNSKGQDIFISALFLLDILLLFDESYELAAYIGLLSMLPIIGKHRGWTHSRLAALAVPLPILLLPLLNNDQSMIGLPYYIAGVAGYFSHLLLDGLLFKKFGR